MAQIILDIQPNKIGFFIELIKNFKFIKVKSMPNEVNYEDGDTREEIIANIKESVAEYKLVLEGKSQARNAREFLKELKRDL